MIIVAFDIGFKNLAWSSVSYRNNPQLLNVSSIIDDTVENSIVEQMNILNFDIFDATANVETNSKNMMEIYKKIHAYLDSLEYVWSSVDVFLIEQQMSTGKIYNVKALKISQHILAYFMIRHPSKKILEFGANYKTACFGVAFRKKKERKDWSIEKVSQLIEQDPVIQDYMDTFKKKDDVCDCILMTFVYFFQTLKNIY